MSDYPNHDDAWRWWMERPPHTGARDTAHHIARKAIDWHRARANPAPQEPPTDQHFDCPCGGFSLYHAHGWAWMPQEPPAEPTEAPKPTSGDEP